MNFPAKMPLDAMAEKRRQLARGTKKMNEKKSITIAPKKMRKNKQKQKHTSRDEIAH